MPGSCSTYGREFPGPPWCRTMLFVGISQATQQPMLEHIHVKTGVHWFDGIQYSFHRNGRWMKVSRENGRPTIFRMGEVHGQEIMNLCNIMLSILD